MNSSTKVVVTVLLLGCVGVMAKEAEQSPQLGDGKVIPVAERGPVVSRPTLIVL